MVSGNPVVDTLLGIAAVIAALGVIWQKGLRPILRAAQKVNETLPVLVDIAEEFRPDEGGSLHDIITKMAADGQILSDYAHGAKHDTIAAVATLQGWQNVHGERLDAFIEETTRRFKELGLEVSTVKNDMATVMTIIDRREEPR